MTAFHSVPPLTRRHQLTALFIGLAIPAGAFGTAAILSMATAALLCGLSVPDRGNHLRRTLLTALFHPLGLLTCLMLLAWLPNLLASPVPVETAKTWGRVAGVIAGGVYLWSILDRNTRLIQRSQDTLVIVTAVVLLMTGVAIIFFPEHVMAFRNSYTPWLRYKFFASALVCLLPVIAYYGWENPTVWRRVAACVAVVASGVIIIGTESRSSIAGLGAASIVTMLVVAFRQPNWRLPLMLVGLAITAGIVFVLRQKTGMVGENIGALGLPEWLIDYHRQHIWLFIIERIPETLWFGHGLNAIAHIPGADHLVPGTTQAFVPSHPHNWLVELLAEAGVVGFMPALALVGCLIARDAWTLVRQKSPRCLARLALSVTFWVSACFNFSIWAPWWGITYIFLYLLLSARPEITHDSKRMLFVVTEDSAFLSHRVPMARAAKSLGLDVAVVCAVRHHRLKIEALGYAVIPWSVDRASTNPLREYLALNALRRIYEAETPVLVHHVAVKPVAYGSIAAQLAGIPHVVNAMIGLGFLFINEDRKAGLLRRIVLAVLRLTLNHPAARLLVQNTDDAAAFTTSGIIPADHVAIIPGSGVDIAKFHPLPEPPASPVVVSVVSRMLWDKGIGEVVEAAAILKQRQMPVEIRLIGDVDPANPRSIHPSQLCMWNAEGTIVWKGARSDIAQVWAESHIAVLPSYREGMPKSLLEAAACGRPLITTDAPGCRSLVADGDTGILVPVKNATALADAIARLVETPDLRQQMGLAARRMVEHTHADPIIEKSVARFYRSLIQPEVIA